MAPVSMMLCLSLLARHHAIPRIRDNSLFSADKTKRRYVFHLFFCCFYLLGSGQCAHFSSSFLPDTEGRGLNQCVVTVSKNSCMCVYFLCCHANSCSAKHRRWLGIGRRASGLRGGPIVGIFAYDGSELSEGQVSFWEVNNCYFFQLFPSLFSTTSLLLRPLSVSFLTGPVRCFRTTLQRP